jgi:hypothetical protein
VVTTIWFQGGNMSSAIAIWATTVATVDVLARISLMLAGAATAGAARRAAGQVAAERGGTAAAAASGPGQPGQGAAPEQVSAIAQTSPVACTPNLRRPAHAADDRHRHPARTASPPRRFMLTPQKADRRPVPPELRSIHPAHLDTIRSQNPENRRTRHN